MKKIMFASFAIICTCMISCNDSGTTAGGSDSTSDSNAAKYKQINRDVLKGLENGDTTKFTGIGDDIVDHTPMGDIKGGDSVRRFLANMHKSISNLKVDIHGEAVDGDYLYCWSTMSGTTVDGSMGMPAGKSFSWKGVDVVRFKDGKAVEHWAYMDPKDMMGMGAQPAPSGSAPVKDTSRLK